VSGRVYIILGLALLAPAAVIHGQGRVPANGSEVFRFALFQHEIRPVTHWDEAQADPTQTIVVLIGVMHALEQPSIGIDGLRLRQFVAQGGSVLVATDGPAGVPMGAALRPPRDWAEQFGIKITPLTLTADPNNCYRRRAGQPFVKPAPFGAWDQTSPHDLFKDLQNEGALPIATSLPHEMSIANAGNFLIKPLAGYADGARRMTGGQRVGPDMNHFAVSLQPQGFRDNPNGRMIVLANRAVFTNGMMGFVKDDGGRFDNGNWAFANRTIEWLQGPVEAPRSRCLFIEDGQVIDRFAIELPPNVRPGMPNIPPDVIANWLLNSANPMLEEAQQKDTFNRILEHWLGFPRLLRVFLITVTVLFILVCFRRLIRGYRKSEPAATITPSARDALLPRGGVLRQRTASQIEVGNLYEAARRRVRERFDVLGARPTTVGQMPPVLTANDLPDGPLLYQSVRWLWVLGYGEALVGVPPDDWDRTNVLLERVTARAARGDWSFGQDAP
jgi:hypothetical protein